MKITFKKMTIHNFLSYADEEFDFSSHKGMNLICGKNYDIPGSKNGCGKSSLSNALIYGLFGQLPYKLKNENIVNRFVSDKNMSVSLYFDVSGKHFHIISGLQRGKQSYCNLFSIEGGKEKDITKSTIAETRKYLEKEIIKCDLNLFMRTIVLNSDPTYNFYNLGKQEKTEFIDKLFDLSIFGDMFGLIKTDVNRLEKEVNRKQDYLMLLNKNAEEYQERSNSYDKEKNEKIKSLESEYQVKKEELDEKTSNVTKKNDEILKKCEVAMEKLEKNISETNEKLRDIEFKIDSSKMTVKRNAAMISDRNKILKTHETLHSKLCDDCKVVFSKHYNLDKYASEIETLSAKNETEKATQVSLLKDKEEITAKKSDNVSKYNKIKKNVDEANATFEREQRNIRTAEREVDSLKTRIDNEKNSENPYGKMIAENKANMDITTKELDEVIEKYKYSKTAKDIVDQNNLKKFIIKDLVGLLNNRIKKYLHRLGADYDIEFDTDMNYEFRTHNHTEAEFHNFSSGEQARLAISTCFAFRDFLAQRNSISSNILILDEFVDSNIDSMAIENILEILGEFVKIDKQNIFVVSHRSEVNNDAFKQIIQIEKKNKISTIMYI